MFAKLLVALAALLAVFSTSSAQLYAPAYTYAAAYPSYSPYYGYASYAAYPAVYAWGSNKGAPAPSSSNPGNVKLTNNQ